jgi:hypothetical protein
MNNYAQAALDRECEILATTAIGRNDQANRSAFSIGQLCGPDGLDPREVERRLLAACEANGYVQKDGAAAARATIRSGLEKGMRQPRGIPQANGDARHRPAGTPRLSGVPVPDWTPPQDGKPRFDAVGRPEPRRINGEIRRHVYRRDGEPVRVKVKRDGSPPFLNVYRVRRPSDGAVGWQAKKPAGYVPVPYIGAVDPFDPELADDTIFCPEGEKDVDTLARLGLPAFTFGGASDLPDSCEEMVRGRDVVILADNDQPGRDHAEQKAERFARTAAKVRVVHFPELPEGHDVTDWVELGGDAEKLMERCQSAAVWEATGERDEESDDSGGEADDALPFVGFDDLQVEVQKPWIAKHVVALGETSSWIGGPGKGKSALLTDIAIHAGSERDWRGHKAKGRFGVVYLALERADLVKRRLEAYKRKHGLKGLPIVVVTKPVDLMEPAAVRVLVATIKKVASRYGVEVGLLIIDTFAKAIAYGNGDENSARDQNRVRGHLREVQRGTGVHIALVGHTGKDETKGERGSNAGLGDVDVEVRIHGDLAKTAVITKANDQADGPLTTYTLEKYIFGTDEDGDEITTSIISDEVPNAEPNKLRTKLNHAEQVALRALADTIIECGEPPPASNHIPQGVQVVEKEAWRRYSYKAGISAGDASDDARRMAFKRAVEGLQNKRLIGVWEPYVWETRP